MVYGLTINCIIDHWIRCLYSSTCHGRPLLLTDTCFRRTLSRCTNYVAMLMSVYRRQHFYSQCDSRYVGRDWLLIARDRCFSMHDSHWTMTWFIYDVHSTTVAIKNYGFWQSALNWILSRLAALDMRILAQWHISIRGIIALDQLPVIVFLVCSN